MTLMERAFMLDLIKRSFDKKMIRAFGPIITGLALGITGISLPESINYPNLDVILIALGFMMKIVGLIQGALTLPWSTKKQQLAALNDHKDTDFDFLLCSVPLKEFFE